MTDEELDRRHNEIVVSYPKGLSPSLFRQLTLESADEEGRVYPPSVTPWLAGMSLVIGMHIEGLIDNRGGGHNKPFKWHISEKGRAILAAERTPS